MRTFQSIEKLDTGILYCLELASSISVLLLAFGLIASMANVLTKGSVLTDSAIMRQIWAWTQCIAIDASVAGTILRTFHYYQQDEKVKMWVYALLSVLLLVTAAIVSNIEAVQQTLNLTLTAAYAHVFVPVELLIWIRSIAIVLLIVAHALRHVQLGKPQGQEPVTAAQEEKPLRIEITPDLVEALRQALTGVMVVSEEPRQLAAPTEERAETLQLPESIEEAEPLERVLQELTRLLPHLARSEITAVVNAYRNGTTRRDMCKALSWGAARYKVVKQVLDVYEQLQQV